MFKINKKLFFNFKIEDPIIYFINLNKIFKNSIYYSFFFSNNSNNERFIFFGFSKKNKLNILKICFVIISYEYFKNIKFKKKNSFLNTKYFSINPEFFFIFDKYRKEIYIVSKNKKKNIIKIKKIISLNINLIFKNFFYKISIEKNGFKKKYKKNFLKIKKNIFKGNIMQIQISKEVFIKTNIYPYSLINIFKKKGNNIFFFSLLKFCFFSLSPEVQIKKNKKYVYLYPIAGTVQRGKNFFFDLIYEFKLSNDSKENSEHLMLIDLARNDLNKISIVGKTNLIYIFKIKKFVFIQHITSCIKTKTSKNICDKKIIESSFPSGTLTGAPKKSAMIYIENIEKTNRGIYGGGFGLIGRRRIELFINIRSIFILKNYALIKSASGIVFDSKIKNEWRELNNKLKSFILKK
ncbi:chorismate-binding protein [Candidatus Vidania fulgoroideorum]